MIEGKELVLYAAFKSKDARFDGQFFVGVRTTGICCRQICRARLPKAENCTYYLTAAEAEDAGFRPCLKCGRSLHRAWPLLMQWLIWRPASGLTSGPWQDSSSV